jgi:hypothetical protein
MDDSLFQPLLVKIAEYCDCFSFLGQLGGRCRLFASEIEAPVTDVRAGDDHKVILFWGPQRMRIAQDAATGEGQG